MELLLQILVWCSPALLGLLAYGFMKLNQFYSAKITNESLRGVLTRLNDSVETAVKSIGQSYVDTLKKSGDFGPEARAVAKKQAIEVAKSYMGQKGLDEVKKVLGWSDDAVEANLGDKVEAKVSELKG